MEYTQLGGFEEIVLLTVGVLDGNAYGVSIKAVLPPSTRPISTPLICSKWSGAAALRSSSTPNNVRLIRSNILIRESSAHESGRPSY